MKYIYDIYLNFNPVIYDFYDWNKNDKIIYIKKIPIFKLSSSDFKKILQYNFKVEPFFIKTILNKTEGWNFNGQKIISSLFTNESDIIAVSFNKNGESIQRSTLIINEQNDILNNLKKLNTYNLKLKVTNKIKYSTKTRKQLETEKFIEKELKSTNLNRLKYIFFECFGKKENNKSVIIKKLTALNELNPLYEKLYNILKLTSTNENKML